MGESVGVRASIDTVLEKSYDLFNSIGDCGDEYR